MAVAVHLGLGKGMPRDVTLAVKLWTKACDGGDAKACLTLAQAIEEPGAVKSPDLMKVAELYRKACDGGYADGCTMLAWSYRKGRGVPHDLSMAFAFYDRGCRGGSQAACVGTGNAFERGEGVPADGKKALEIYARACSANHGGGCWEAARYLSDVKKEDRSDVPYLEKGCNLNEGYSCFGLARGYESGRHGVIPNAAKAFELFGRSCKAGCPSGCAGVAQMLIHANGTDRDDARARSMSKVGCDEKVPHGCHILGYLLLGGLGGPRDASAAKKVLAEACTLGDHEACDGLDP